MQLHFAPRAPLSWNNAPPIMSRWLINPPLQTPSCSFLYCLYKETPVHRRFQCVRRHLKLTPFLPTPNHNISTPIPRCTTCVTPTSISSYPPPRSTLLATVANVTQPIISLVHNWTELLIYRGLLLCRRPASLLAGRRPPIFLCLYFFPLFLLSVIFLGSCYWALPFPFLSSFFSAWSKVHRGLDLVLFCQIWSCWRLILKFLVSFWVLRSRDAVVIMCNNR